MSSVNLSLEPGVSGGEIVLVPEISPYAHLKHLDARANGVGAQ